MAMMDSEAWITSPIVMHLSCTLYLRSGVKLESDLNNRKKTISVVVFLGQIMEQSVRICVVISFMWKIMQVFVIFRIVRLPCVILDDRSRTGSTSGKQEVVFLGQRIDRYAWICILIISIDP